MKPSRRPAPHRPLEAPFVSCWLMGPTSPRAPLGDIGSEEEAAATGPDLPSHEYRFSSASLPLSVQVNADPPKQRIDGTLQLPDHRADPPSLDEPLARARLQDTSAGA